MTKSSEREVGKGQKKKKRGCRGTRQEKDAENEDEAQGYARNKLQQKGRYKGGRRTVGRYLMTENCK